MKLFVLLYQRLDLLIEIPVVKILLFGICM